MGDEKPLSIPEVAATLGISERFVRNAIGKWRASGQTIDDWRKTGSRTGVPAFFLGGQSIDEPHKGGGPGRGWRIWRADMQQWFFGGPAPK